MYQTDGIPIPRCGSLARRADFDAVFDGPTTQSFEPIWWSPAIPSAPSSPARARMLPPAAATRRQAAASAGDRTAASAVPTGRVAAVAPPPRAAAAVAPAPPEPSSPLGVITGIAGS